MTAHACNPSIPEAEAGVEWTQVQPEIRIQILSQIYKQNRKSKTNQFAFLQRTLETLRLRKHFDVYKATSVTVAVNEMNTQSTKTLADKQSTIKGSSININCA